MTNAFLGGGSLFTNALWGSSGSFLNLSADGVNNGTVLNVTRDGLASFTAGFVGNMAGGATTNGFIRWGASSLAPAGSGIFTRIATHGVFSLMDFTNNLGGNLISNRLENVMQK